MGTGQNRCAEKNGGCVEDRRQVPALDLEGCEEGRDGRRGREKEGSREGQIFVPQAG